MTNEVKATETSFTRDPDLAIGSLIGRPGLNRI